MEQDKQSELLLRSYRLLTHIKSLFMERLVMEHLTATSTEDDVLKQCNELITELKKEIIDGTPG